MNTALVSITQTQQVISSGLSYYWPCRESSGGIINNYTKNINTGYLSGPSLSVGNMAVYFNGNGQVTFSTCPLSPGSGDFTLNYWIKSNLSGNIRTAILCFGNYNNDQCCMMEFNGGSSNGLNSVTTGSISFLVFGENSPQAQLYTTAIITDRSWHNISAVCQSQTVNLYVDGSPNGTTYNYGSLNIQAGRANFLGTDANNYYLDQTYIGNIRIYNRALSSSEISALYLGTMDEYN